MIDSDSRSIRGALPAWWILLPILLLAALVYSSTIGVYYCSYDDFKEGRRAALEDNQDWTRTFSTSHFHSFKYRPVGRLIQLWSYRLRPQDPTVMRLRNVGCHLVSVALVFGIAQLLFGSPAVSGVAALLFALRPSANQHINGALWPNMVSHMFFLATIYVFLQAWQRRRPLLLVCAVILGGLTIGVYEASMVIFAVLPLYVLIDWLWRKNSGPNRQLVATFCIVSVLVLGAWWAARSFATRAIRARNPAVLSVAAAVKGEAAHWASISTPVDFVWASRVLGDPLPPRLNLRELRKLEFFILGGIILLGGVLTYRAWILYRAGTLEGPQLFFLVVTTGLTFALQSLFAHPSESYVYPGSATLSIAIAQLLVGGGNGSERMRVTGWVLVVILAVLGLIGVRERNQELAICGSTVQRIFSSLPLDRFRQGSWQVYFASPADETLPEPYGLYERRGVQAVGWGDSRSTAFEWALQMLTLNPKVRGGLLTAAEVPQRCEATGPGGPLCYWVYSDGRTIPVHIDGR
jgi:hypothetical protein